LLIHNNGKKIDIEFRYATPVVDTYYAYAPMSAARDYHRLFIVTLYHAASAVSALLPRCCYADMMLSL